MLRQVSTSHMQSDSWAASQCLRIKIKIRNSHKSQCVPVGSLVLGILHYQGGLLNGEQTHLSSLIFHLIPTQYSGLFVLIPGYGGIHLAGVEHSVLRNTKRNTDTVIFCLLLPLRDSSFNTTLHSRLFLTCPLLRGCDSRVRSTEYYLEDL